MWSSARTCGASQKPNRFGPFTALRLIRTRSRTGRRPVDWRERHEDVELFTPHYRGAHAVSRAKTGFRIYVVGSRGSGGRSAPHPGVVEELL